ncbi:MAG: hypothetical protein U0270_21635 [Labilithrix sp.]
MCSPLDVPPFGFTSPGAYTSQCSRAELKLLYDACVSDQNTIDGCNEARKTHSECAQCVIGSGLAKVQHPWVMYADFVVPFPNYGLCMATYAGETKTTDCGVAYGLYDVCLSSACVEPCAADGDADAYDQCRQAASDTECFAGQKTALSLRCRVAYGENNPTYGFCTSGRDEQGKRLDDAGYMIALANLVCGSKPKLDAGTDGEAGTP